MDDMQLPKLETIDDLIAQFNLLGFIDLCIYPPARDMVSYSGGKAGPNKFVYNGHSKQNRTGNVYYESVNVRYI